MRARLSLRRIIWRDCARPRASGKLTGEATPKYLYSDMARARLAQEAERVRLIVLLRNPIDMAAAMHAQNVRQGTNPTPISLRAWARGPAVPDDKMTDYRFSGADPACNWNVT